MKDKTKKAYHKPELTRVKLVPEEAVLAYCKTATVAGPDSAPLGCTVVPTQCSDAVS